MQGSTLKKNLCVGIEPKNEDDHERKVEKVLAPFLKTLKKNKKSKVDIIAEDFNDLYMKSSPLELLRELQKNYCDTDLLKTLLNETGELLKAVTNSKCFNLYTTDYERGIITLVSDYTPKSNRFLHKFPIETGTYLASYVAHSKEYVIASDILGDIRFPQGIPNAGFTVKAVICLPIITNVQNKCIGVIELYRDFTKPPYTIVNLEICSALLAWMGIALEQHNINLVLTKEMEIRKQITQLATLYFSRVITFEKTISSILTVLKANMAAEKASFYVFQETVPPDSDDVLYADSYEEGITDLEENTLLKRRTKLSYNKNEPGIPGYVARTGEVMNIRDAYKDARFDRKRDAPFFRTRSLLCYPIKSTQGVVAVLKLMNRLDYPYFKKEDIETLQSYLSEVALICQHYELDAAFVRWKLKYNEIEKLLDIQTKPPVEEMVFFRSFLQSELQMPPGFNKFDWDGSNFDDESHRYVALAFELSDILEPLFDLQNLADFLLRVRRGYRSVSYHNFEHAFNVFHCTYLMVHKNKETYNVNEVVALLLASICHDVDHPGFTNNFLSLKNDLLVQLYEDYAGEEHRFEFTMFFIQVSNLFWKFSNEDYQAICKIMRKLFIGFDMAVHFSNRKKITELLNENTFDWTNSDHRYLSQNMLLICADNCICFKSFEVIKKHVTNFYKELHHQGDLEKLMEYEPLPMLDRSKSDLIPENQIILITIIILPLLSIIEILFTNLATLKTLVIQTLEKWKEVKSMKGQEMWKMSLALVKDKKDKRGHRVSVSRSSSIKTFLSER